MSCILNVPTLTDNAQQFKNDLQWVMTHIQTFKVTITIIID